MSIMQDSSGRGISELNPLAVRQIQSDVILPIDIQSRYAQTIQTHNAVSVGASGNSSSSWIDCDGFDKVAFTVANDASTNNNADVYWSNDGVNTHGIEGNAIPNAAQPNRTVIVDVKARYVKLRLNNADTIAHTMSAWAYLKA